MELSCPLPHENTEKVLLSMGGGGRHMARLLEDVFFKHFDNAHARHRHDASVFSTGGKPMAMTCDGHVVRPLFFPGGNIGSLAIHGTVNDLACGGARPQYFSVGFILEEGLPLAQLEQACISMRAAADEVGALLVTGDTKVVERGRCDGMYITVTGVGEVMASTPIEPASINENDVIVVSGDIGRHGIAVMASREGLSFETELLSDSAAIWPAVKALIDAKLKIHCIRDLTRGGLGAALHEMATTSERHFHIEEATIPVEPAVAGACEILGLEPLFVACEGRFAVVLPEDSKDDALRILGPEARCIGRVSGQGGKVTLRAALGTTRTMLLPSGEQLPRIC